MSRGIFSGAVSSFLMQQFWWATTVPSERLGFNRRGLHTALRTIAHRRLERKVHIGILTGGLVYPNIIDLQAFWMNERLRNCRTSIDPDPETADIFWIYSQDPLPEARRSAISEAIARARPGTPVINRLDAYDFYHRNDAFSLLAAAGVPVPRSQFGASDHGLPVIWKPAGLQSKTRGPVPYAGAIQRDRAFEYINVADADGCYWRYRACFVLGDIYAASGFRSADPIVRYRNVNLINRDWMLTENEIGHIRRIAEVSRLDFFTVDFLRRAEDQSPVFVDINVFSMAKDAYAEGWYGHLHDFDKMRPAGGRTESLWPQLDSRLLEMASGSFPRQTQKGTDRADRDLEGI